MTEQLVERWRDSQIEHILVSPDPANTHVYYLKNIVGGIATSALSDHLCPRGQWAKTIPAKRRALADGIDAAIKELEAIKTAFNLGERKENP